ncbi:MAG: DUF4374 domain-containing protein [Tannerellaceae bacterium]|jgi:hypothetical protein|nr:DUF4374 domain-containing protein [Tannerellaceae bacterium]
MSKFAGIQGWALSMGSVLLFASCDKENDVPEPTVEGNFQYVVVATPEGTFAEGADYLLQTGSLSEGSITTVGAGWEQDGYRYYAFHKNKVFSFLYGQGNPGAVTTYGLGENGMLAYLSNLQTETVQVFGACGEDLILIKCPRSFTDVNAGIYRVDAVNPRIVDTRYVDIAALAGNGELAHFTGAFQVGDKVYAPYMCIKDNYFRTDLTDSVWIAVFSYPDMTLEKVIRDGRTSYIGHYFALSGVTQVENGDVYTFSCAPIGHAAEGIVPSTKPSAVLRIKKGTSEFDKDYFFNIQETSGGYHVHKAFYLGGTKFLLTLHADRQQTPQYGDGKDLKFAIVDVVTESFTWVTGMPEPEHLVHVSRLPYIAEDGSSISFGITVTDEYPHVYTIDISTAQATKGLEVISGCITSLGRLSF